MITTIQINESTKKALGRMKQTNKETYEKIILDLIKFADKQKRKQKDLLIEGCKEMSEENLGICEEFKYVDGENIPEW